jgi:transposase
MTAVEVIMFRGRRGYLLKAVWWDGQGLCLYAKRLEKGRFVWRERGADVGAARHAIGGH